MPELAVFSPGTISHRFMEGMKDVRGARVTAFITRNPENCRKYAAEYGISTVGTFEEVIRTRRIEGVYISSPTFLHADHIRLCLEHDLHVFCEKPVTVKREEYEILLSLAHQRGLVFMEAQKALYLPAFLEIRSLLEANALGTVHTVRADSAEMNIWKKMHGAEQCRAEVHFMMSAVIRLRQFSGCSEPTVKNLNGKKSQRRSDYRRINPFPER